MILPPTEFLRSFLRLRIPPTFRIIIESLWYSAISERTPMKSISTFFTLLLCLLLPLSGIQAAGKYSQIQIFVADRSSLSSIWSSGIDYEGAEGKPGGWMKFVASDYELQHLSAKGISYQIIIDDLAGYTEGLLP